ncbi:MAG TPA: helix-hairpin-helix domain-containing protein, partial [Desulfosarcina sp.]|nr:helix-hairpin-helix domain-containing protein [Desulfosarcina sp.]
MPVQNVDVSDIFTRLANLLEIRDANPFRVRAYRNAARTVANMARSVADMVAADEDLTELEGVGEDLAAKIEEIVATGTLDQLSALERKMPGDFDALLRINGLGPKRIARLHEALGIENPDQLKAAAEAHRIRELPGFGKKTEETFRREAARIGPTK